MKGIIAASLLALSVFFGISPALALVPAPARPDSTTPDPCTGPRGDGTFTPQELLSLFTLKAVPADDGHGTHYRVTVLACKDGSQPIVTLVLDPKHTTLSVAVDKDQRWDFRPETGVKSIRDLRVWLWAIMTDLKKNIKVADQGKTRTLTLVTVPSGGRVGLMGLWEDGSFADQVRRQGRRFTALVHAIRRTHGKEPIILKGLSVSSYYDPEVCPATEADAVIDPMLVSPRQVFVGKELLWENKH